MIDIRMPQNSNMSIDGKSVYRLYLMLKNHFNGKCDVIKYNWSIRVSDKSYQKRKDRYFFERLSEKYNLKELVLLMISNMVSNQDAWIGDLSDSDAIDFYRSYVVKLKSVRDTIEEDLGSIYYFSKKLNITLNQVINYNEKMGSSYLLKLLQSQIITAETFLFLDSFLGIINKYDSEMSGIIWENYSTKLNAYKKLLIIDKETAKNLFKETIKKLKET